MIWKMNLTLWTLVLFVLLCKFVNGACPDGCFCTRSSRCNGTRVYCRNTGLNQVPTNIPTDTCHLDLEGNHITTLKYKAFGSLSNLQSLDLRWNQITTMEKNTFDGLSKLQTLYLSANEIFAIPDDAFHGSANLEILGLSYNRITIIQDNAFNGLQNLSSLYLNDNKITRIDANTFNGLSNLEKLYLNGNKITRINENTFNGLPNLEKLYLNGNKITRINENTFNGLPNLEKLAVEKNPLHCDCILADFVRFAKSRNLTLKYRKEPRCSTPSNLTGVLLHDLSVEEMGCSSTTTTTIGPKTSGRMIISTLTTETSTIPNIYFTTGTSFDTTIFKGSGRCLQYCIGSVNN